MTRRAGRRRSCCDGIVSCPLFFPIQAIRLHSHRFQAGYAFRAHTQAFHQFYCVLDGVVAQRVEGTVHRLRAGEGVWIAPGLEREPRAESQSGQYMVVDFSPPWPELGAGSGMACKLDRRALADARELAALRAVVTANLRVAILFHRLCLSVLPVKWFDRLPAGDGARAGGPIRAGKARTVAEELARVERIEQMMSANTGNPLRLEELAALSGLSRSALGRLFVAHRNESPCARFRTIRLERARQLLEDGERSVTEVAMETGFSTSQHFAGAFRKKFGRSPSEVLKGTAQSR
ncbi:AraC family transcriptional regulator [Opitutaceae bacterium TAV5]|nr:AraC family transcriptional regulator [Opitutaceae bacterium TAV5]